MTPFLKIEQITVSTHHAFNNDCFCHSFVLLVSFLCFDFFIFTGVIHFKPVKTQWITYHAEAGKTHGRSFEHWTSALSIRLKGFLFQIYLCCFHKPHGGILFALTIYTLCRYFSTPLKKNYQKIQIRRVCCFYNVYDKTECC